MNTIKMMMGSLAMLALMAIAPEGKAQERKVVVHHVSPKQKVAIAQSPMARTVHTTLTQKPNGRVKVVKTVRKGPHIRQTVSVHKPAAIANRRNALTQRNVTIHNQRSKVKRARARACR